MVVKVNNPVNTVYNDPNFNGIVKDSAKDGRIDKSESQQLKHFIDSTNISDDDKNRIFVLIDSLSDTTTKTEKFLFSSKEITKELSDFEIHGLKEIAGNNKLAQKILNAVIDVQQPKQNDTANISSGINNKSKNSVSSSVSFVDSNEVPVSASHTNGITKNSHSDNFKDWYRTQFTANDLELIKEGRFKEVKNADCGPTSAAMVLQANGFSVPGNDQIRKDLKIKHKHAISVPQLSEAVKKYSNGEMKQFVNNSYKSGNMDKMLNDLRSELEKGRMPVLLTSAMSANNGHYTVVMAVKDNGNVIVADPSNPYGPREYTKEDLLAAMKRRDSIHMPNTIISFGKN